jgi:ribosomal protein L11 methylase PrmA
MLENTLRSGTSPAAPALPGFLHDLRIGRSDTVMQRDPASFRDPSGHVYHHGDHVYRSIARRAAATFSAIRARPLLAELCQQGRLISFEEVPASAWPREAASLDAAHLIKHPRIPFVSYPYEWPFEALRTAALFHLDLHLDLLTDDLTLSDASAYNVQFVGSRPSFIDLLSIRPYVAGEYWLGHDQFVRQFLNPLLLEAWCNVGFAAFYRGAPEGIASAELARLLPWRAQLRPSLQLQVFMPARFSNSASSAGKAQVRRPDRPLSKAAFVHMLKHLRRVIAGLAPKRGQTTWSKYAGATSYAEPAAQAKRDFVKTFSASVRPRRLADLGCNDGEYSLIALDAGASSVIGLDTDRPSLDRAFSRAREKDLSLLPLHVDLANPSPGQGWAGRERAALGERLQPDALLALALVHHLAIGRNVPLDDIVEFLVVMAPTGVLEFVPKEDPMIERMLRLREDIFPDYDAEHFRSAILRRAAIVQEVRLPDSGRLLFWYAAKA